MNVRTGWKNGAVCGRKLIYYLVPERDLFHRSGLGVTCSSRVT